MLKLKKEKITGRLISKLKLKELRKILYTYKTNQYFKTLDIETGANILIKKLIKIEYSSCGSEKLIDLLEGRRKSDFDDLKQEGIAIILEDNLKLYNEKDRKKLIKKLRKYLKSLLNYSYQCVAKELQDGAVKRVIKRVDVVELDALEDRKKEEVYKNVITCEGTSKKLNKNQIDFIKNLTDKQKSIVYEIANGCSYSQIAEHLSLSVGTIKTTMYRLKKYAMNISQSDGVPI